MTTPMRAHKADEGKKDSPKAFDTRRRVGSGGGKLNVGGAGESAGLSYEVAESRCLSGTEEESRTGKYGKEREKSAERRTTNRRAITLRNNAGRTMSAGEVDDGFCGRKSVSISRTSDGRRNKAHLDETASKVGAPVEEGGEDGSGLGCRRKDGQG
jgi:hypothetical protein